MPVSSGTNDLVVNPLLSRAIILPLRLMRLEILGLFVYAQSETGFRPHLTSTVEVPKSTSLLSYTVSIKCLCSTF